MRKVFIPIIFIILLSSGYIHAGFIVNEEVIPETLEETLQNSEKDVKAYLPRINKINAIPINLSEVMVTWEKLNMSGVLYTVYRSEQPMITRQRVALAFKVGTVVDFHQIVDKTIYKPGIYYYAVTTSSKNTKEDRNLIPDRSYTTKGLSVNSVMVNIVLSINAKTTTQGVDLTWQCPSFSAGNYEVYRNTVPIENSQFLKSSKLIKTAKSNETYCLDPEALSEQMYYYAVMIRNSSGVLNEIFVDNQNYTVMPVKPPTDLRPVSMNLVREGSNVKINWVFAGNTGLQNYLIIKSKKRPLSMMDAVNGVQLNQVNLTSTSYYDKKENNDYYYLLVPINFNSYNDYRIVEGINYVSKYTNSPMKKKSKTKINDNDESSESGNTGNVVYSDLDAVLKNLYSKRLFNEAEKAFMLLESKTKDPAKLAKIRYYIGRTKVEKGEYRDALNYFSRKDVKKFHSKESKFWIDYCLLRMN